MKCCALSPHPPHPFSPLFNHRCLPTCIQQPHHYRIHRWTRISCTAKHLWAGNDYLCLTILPASHRPLCLPWPLTHSQHIFPPFLSIFPHCCYQVSPISLPLSSAVLAAASCTLAACFFPPFLLFFPHCCYQVPPPALVIGHLLCLPQWFFLCFESFIIVACNQPSLAAYTTLWSLNMTYAHHKCRLFKIIWYDRLSLP